MHNSKIPHYDKKSKFCPGIFHWARHDGKWALGTYRANIKHVENPEELVGKAAFVKRNNGPNSFQILGPLIYRSARRLVFRNWGGISLE